MTEINKKLRSGLLPAPMIITNYVEGDENCNYEKYLLEIVNASEMFRLLSGGKEYTAPDNEAHGENDANSEEYSLDFKLVESSSYKSTFSNKCLTTISCAYQDVIRLNILIISNFSLYAN